MQYLTNVYFFVISFLLLDSDLKLYYNYIVITDDKTVQAKELLLQLTKAVFWNYDIDKFDYTRDKKIIIERILDAGLENDEIIMWKLYSYDDIKNVALNMEYLHEDKVTYMAFVLKVEENEFKCYKKKPWYRK